MNVPNPTNPHSWGPAVERAASAIARMTWGNVCWYRGAANAALTDVYGLDPKDTQRILYIYHDDENES